MKTTQYCFFTFLLCLVFSFQSFGQSEPVIGDNSPFQYLIGMEYSKTSELGDFKRKARFRETNSEGDMRSSIHLISENQTIITSEKLWFDETKKREVRRIDDILVIEGKFTSCGSCLSATKKGNYILTIYPEGSRNDDLLLFAFQRHRKTGRFKEVNPDKLERNPLYLADLD